MVSPLHIYTGYTEEDLELLRSFVIRKAEIMEDYYIDGFGQKTLFASVPFCKTFNVERLTVPFPDDGFHAETIEYFSVCNSIKKAGDSYKILEVGAGWGPWISLGGVLARNKGIKSVTIIGVEAQPERFALMKEQLTFNQLRPSSIENVTTLNGIRCRLVNGAISTNHKTLWFPKVDITDMGARAADSETAIEYRGLGSEIFPVPGYTLNEVVGNLTIDLLHMDIQGSEFEVLQSAIELINKQVKSMLIATHDRVIEGKLIEMLYKNGWYLHREKPCRVDWKKSPTSMEAMTIVDGGQYWQRENY